MKPSLNIIEETDSATLGGNTIHWMIATDAIGQVWAFVGTGSPIGPFQDIKTARRAANERTHLFFLKNCETYGGRL